MFGLARYLVPVVLLALVALVPGAEAASLKAKPSLVKKGKTTRLVVKLSSKGSVGARQRPRAVSVKAGKRKYKLSRARGAVAAVNLGTWRSDAYRRRAARKLNRAAGTRVKVRIESRAGTTTVRSRLAAPEVTEQSPGDDPAPGEGDDPPEGGDAPPGGGDVPPAEQPGDVTGQEAIDQMTAEISGGAVRRFSSSSSGDLTSSYQLHFCSDGRFRYYFHETFRSGEFSQVNAIEETGQPWTVVEALIKADGTYRGARVQGTFTERRTASGGERSREAINEPAEVLIEWLNGQWYWDKEPVETDTASCDPTL